MGGSYSLSRVVFFHLGSQRTHFGSRNCIFTLLKFSYFITFCVKTCYADLVLNKRNIINFENSYAA